ncbi:hypothetical protein RHGRI_012117 [Rhododendron griersonianum]|uniref:Uncharacterized protein n=1 Tax=Rhododendron griersonianum TaxID=479676 RepID=A0AAV6KPA2_9ERIC|nr:hypothetical protein RHGRI_012117 [Rhododendron griersonianum]
MEFGNVLNGKLKLLNTRPQVSKVTNRILMKDILLDHGSNASIFVLSRRRRLRADDQMLELWGTAEAKTLRALHKYLPWIEVLSFDPSFGSAKHKGKKRWTLGIRRSWRRADDQMLKLWETAEAKTLRPTQKKKKSVGHQFEDVEQKSDHHPSSKLEVERNWLVIN